VCHHYFHIKVLLSTLSRAYTVIINVNVEALINLQAAFNACRLDGEKFAWLTSFVIEN